MKLLFEDFKKEIEDFNQQQDRVRFTGWKLIPHGERITFVYKKDELEDDNFDFDAGDFFDYLLSEEVIKKEIEFLVKDLAYDNLYQNNFDLYDTYVFIAKKLQEFLIKVKGDK